MEGLEGRQLLAGVVTISQDADNNLLLQGDTAGNEVVITFNGDDNVSISSGPDATTFVNNAADFTVKSITLFLDGGDDAIEVIGNSHSLTAGGLTIDSGKGANDVAIADLTVGTGGSADLSIKNITNSSVRAQTVELTDVNARSIYIWHGAWNSHSTTIDGGATSGDLSINSRGGAGTTHSTTISGTAVGGNASILQRSTANSYLAVVNGSIDGDLTISNGSADNGAAGDATIRVGNLATTSVEGKVTLFNGAASNNNTVTLGSLTTSLIDLDALSVRNHTAGTTNLTEAPGLDMDDSATGGVKINHGRAKVASVTVFDGPAIDLRGSIQVSQRGADIYSGIQFWRGAISGDVAFANGNSLNNQIFFATGGGGGTPGPVTIGGSSILATNGHATGFNQIGVARLTAPNASLTVRNKSAGTDNIFDFAADASTVELGGAITAINGGAGENNYMRLHSGLIGTAGGAAEDVLLRNGVAGAGFNSFFDLGDLASVEVVDGDVTIVDDAGNSFINVYRAAIAGDLFIQTGAGADTVTLGHADGLTIGGATTIRTGEGVDVVSIGLLGKPVTLGALFVNLGAGDDTLSIGGDASGAAFAALANFLFYGGADTDTANLNGDALNAFGLGFNPLSADVAARIGAFETFANLAI